MAFRIQKLVAATVGTAALLALCGSGRAQEAWPARPVQMIVASSAGSGTDALARVMAQRLSVALKQPVVIENRPGGSGVIGTNAVVKAPADGYTILYTTASNQVIAPAVLKTIPYDPKKSLVPIAQTAEGGVMLLVSNDLPVHNLPELIQLVKANPDKYSYATWSMGSSGQLMMEWLKKQTGMKTDHVAYRTSNQLLTDLASGVVKIGWTDPSAPVPFLRSGKVRAIAIGGNVRAPQLPEVKTMGEQGYKFDAVGWFGMFAPAGTNPAIVKRLADEVNKVQASPELAAMMKSMNFGPPPMKTSVQFGETVSHDLQVWAKIAADAKIRLDE
ncbi:tripartite tricarboxylate transporter substrate binding protein [Cupriavidus necator]|uniref:Tripartite tricarboxylate transporter substrate binding protein n=1 Tax=Cupriavidus necator TaxID=106590 RepID=A0A367P8D7_CUPNE|nr:tripartite tricarboxylate transporter substrate binding protein [Cupriavidus necator]QQX88228.1 tripartite tricarboxylate transporter substrate binding protein [Cupriavidus necator]RCJ04108.1 tripartite tricarboxylate transporter substrate binding protein [Cupriavidus necator]